MGGANRGRDDLDEAAGEDIADEEGAVLNVAEAKEAADDAVRLQPGFTSCIKPHQLGSAARPHARLSNARVRLLCPLRARLAAQGGCTRPGGENGSLSAVPLPRMFELASSTMASQLHHG